VIHSKTMSIDGQAGLGRHQQLGRRLFRQVAQPRSRDAQRKDGARVAALHEQAWTRRMRSRSTSIKDYPAPAKAKPNDQFSQGETHEA
jgi:hypothetical protein